VVRPRFSILTPVYNTPTDVLEACIASVQAQTFEDWELCLVDDRSPSATPRAVLERAARADPRIRVGYRDENGGIVAASNDALAMARGEFVALLDHDDIIPPHALERVQAELETSEEIDYLYTDEDKIDLFGLHCQPFHKPGWSPERLRSQNYVCHFSVIRTTLMEDIGGFRSGFDGSQDYDLVLRVTERARRVAHIPEILYHWRMGVGSAAGDTDAKPYAYTAGQRAIAEHCARVGIDADVEIQPGKPGCYRVRRRVQGRPLVSVIIPTRGAVGSTWGLRRPYITTCITSLVDKAGPVDLEFVVVADTATPASVLHSLEHIPGARIEVVEYAGEFNFSEKINRGALRANGDLLLLLNDDIEARSPDVVATMVAIAQQPDVGMVGAKLLYPDGTLQHGGHVYTGNPHHILYQVPGDAAGPFGLLWCERECSGVTAACALVKREVFEGVGGMCTGMAVNFNDVDFSLKIRHLGQRIVWTPFAELYHFESKTREPSVDQHETDALHERWHDALARDPYYNLNLAPGRDDFMLASDV
jgi:glycosyltransferase involved in cell wall biosynthesis